MAESTTLPELAISQKKPAGKTPSVFAHLYEKLDIKTNPTDTPETNLAKKVKRSLVRKILKQNAAISSAIHADHGLETFKALIDALYEAHIRPAPEKRPRELPLAASADVLKKRRGELTAERKRQEEAYKRLYCFIEDANRIIEDHDYKISAEDIETILAPLTVGEDVISENLRLTALVFVGRFIGVMETRRSHSDNDAAPKRAQKEKLEKLFSAVSDKSGRIKQGVLETIMCGIVASKITGRLAKHIRYLALQESFLENAIKLNALLGQAQPAPTALIPMPSSCPTATVAGGRDAAVTPRGRSLSFARRLWQKITRRGRI